MRRDRKPILNAEVNNQIGNTMQTTYLTLTSETATTDTDWQLSVPFLNKTIK